MEVLEGLQHRQLLRAILLGSQSDQWKASAQELGQLCPGIDGNEAVISRFALILERKAGFLHEASFVLEALGVSQSSAATLLAVHRMAGGVVKGKTLRDALVAFGGMSTPRAPPLPQHASGGGSSGSGSGSGGGRNRRVASTPPPPLRPRGRQQRRPRPASSCGKQQQQQPAAAAAQPGSSLQRRIGQSGSSLARARPRTAATPHFPAPPMAAHPPPRSNSGGRSRGSRGSQLGAASPSPYAFRQVLPPQSPCGRPYPSPPLPSHAATTTAAATTAAASSSMSPPRKPSVPRAPRRRSSPRQQRRQRLRQRRQRRTQPKSTKRAVASQTCTNNEGAATATDSDAVAFGANLGNESDSDACSHSQGGSGVLTGDNPGSHAGAKVDVQRQQEAPAEAMGRNHGSDNNSGSSRNSSGNSSGKSSSAPVKDRGWDRVSRLRARIAVMWQLGQRDPAFPGSAPAPQGRSYRQHGVGTGSNHAGLPSVDAAQAQAAQARHLAAVMAEEERTIHELLFSASSRCHRCGAAPSGAQYVTSAIDGFNSDHKQTGAHQGAHGVDTYRCGECDAVLMRKYWDEALLATATSLQPGCAAAPLQQQAGKQSTRGGRNPRPPPDPGLPSAVAAASPVPLRLSSPPRGASTAAAGGRQALSSTSHERRRREEEEEVGALPLAAPCSSPIMAHKRRLEGNRKMASQPRFSSAYVYRTIVYVAGGGTRQFNHLPHHAPPEPEDSSLRATGWNFFSALPATVM